MRIRIADNSDISNLESLYKEEFPEERFISLSQRTFSTRFKSIVTYCQ